MSVGGRSIKGRPLTCPAHEVVAILDGRQRQDLFETRAPASGNSAVISDCGVYRYRLERRTSVGPGGRVAAVIMVNPSTADAATNDATIRKVLGFAERNDIGRVIVGNKFAYRATDIKALRTAADPVGPDNDRHLEQILREADFHLVAWGPLTKLPPRLRRRWRDVVEIARRVGCPLHALATAQCGHPKHPLMLGYGCVPAPWSLPAVEAAPEGVSGETGEV